MRKVRRGVRPCLLCGRLAVRQRNRCAVECKQVLEIEDVHLAALVERKQQRPVASPKDAGQTARRKSHVSQRLDHGRAANESHAKTHDVPVLCGHSQPIRARCRRRRVGRARVAICVR